MAPCLATATATPGPGEAACNRGVTPPPHLIAAADPAALGL